MLTFDHAHVFILPHADEYRRFYDLRVADILDCLNQPELREGLATDHYTAEKTIGDHRVFVYYYLTLPLQGDRDECFAIVDFVSQTEREDKRSLHPHPRETTSGNQRVVH